MDSELFCVCQKLNHFMATLQCAFAKLMFAAELTKK